MQIHSKFNFISAILSACLLSLALLLSGCSKKETESHEIRIGTVSGPETKLLKTVQKVAKAKYDLDVVIVEFKDYNMPNVALNDHNIDANAFQHQPYLEESTLRSSFDLIPLGKTFIYPMGIYSKKYKTIQELPEGAIVAVPNDPSNESRALLLLEKAGLITLTKNVNTFAKPMDVIQNPKKIVIKPMDAALLAKELPNVDLAAINTNFALAADLLPNKDGLVIEGTDSLYANVVAIRAEDKNSPKLQQLMEAFQSPEVIAEAEKLFQGQAIPAWISPGK
jgi:D-methionine transport system substrate-binding protein